MSSVTPTPGELAVREAVAASGPGLHIVHVARNHDWNHEQAHAELLWFGGTMGVHFGPGQREAYDRATALVDAALNSGIARLTVVSEVPPGERSARIYHVEDGRCITVEEYDTERYGKYPEPLAAARRRSAELTARALHWHAPRYRRP